ncbi:MAG: hypothetical protein ABL962_14120 [Fimbriimonadaceae bacterium]
MKPTIGSLLHAICFPWLLRARYTRKDRRARDARSSFNFRVVGYDVPNPMSLHMHVRNVKQWPHDETEFEGEAGAAGVALVEKRLEAYAHLQIERNPGRLTVVVSGAGFEVRIIDDGNEATVATGGWHGHYSSPTEAAQVFVKLLSAQARLRLTLRGMRCTGGTLEFAEGENWIAFERCFLVFGWLRLGRRRVEIVQNRLINL